MASRDQYKIINEKLIRILHDLLATGNWQASLFLKTAHKKLQDIYDQAVLVSKEFEQNNQADQDEEQQLRIKKGFIPVFVSLYQSDAYNIVKWENTLKTIKEHSINRPIYRSEDSIQAMIRSKQGSPNEGYVAIYVHKTDIIPTYAGKSIEDRLGHELLTLRDNSLAPENIIEFVHQSRRYEYREGKLILKSDK